jgi:hypothetical protein
MVFSDIIFPFLGTKSPLILDMSTPNSCRMTPGFLKLNLDHSPNAFIFHIGLGKL